MCSVGVPFTYEPEGAVRSCIDEAYAGALLHLVELDRLDVVGEAAGQVIYGIGRLPMYVLAAGYIAGLGVLLLAALTVRSVMS